MKKIVLVILMMIASSFYAVASSHQDAGELKDKLAKFKLINAQFTQVVTNTEGVVLNESQGMLTISRPGKFRWEVLTPEEELIISDGKIMWLYSPFIEQVTLINLSDAIAGTPFVLLSGATDAQWQKYQVARQDNRFTVKSLDSEELKHSFVFEFADDGSISRFIVIEEQGQRSEFILTDKPLTQEISADYFSFKIPKGVEIDDQR